MNILTLDSRGDEGQAFRASEQQRDADFSFRNNDLNDGAAKRMSMEK